MFGQRVHRGANRRAHLALKIDDRQLSLPKALLVPNEWRDLVENVRAKLLFVFTRRIFVDKLDHPFSPVLDQLGPLRVYLETLQRAREVGDIN
jgi:hypothetical protein